jgi:hypothetical protein
LIDGRVNAADKKGLPDEKLGWIFFPEVKGGKGKANDLFASLNGWLVAKQAPKETGHPDQVGRTRAVHPGGDRHRRRNPRPADESHRPGGG